MKKLSHTQKLYLIKSSSFLEPEGDNVWDRTIQGFKNWWQYQKDRRKPTTTAANTPTMPTPSPTQWNPTRPQGPMGPQGFQGTTTPNKPMYPGSVA